MTLRCNKCGAAPLPGVQTEAGKFHYRKVVRYDASRKGVPLVVMRRCGVWVCP